MSAAEYLYCTGDRRYFSEVRKSTIKYDSLFAIFQILLGRGAPAALSFGDPRKTGDLVGNFKILKCRDINPSCSSRVKNVDDELFSDYNHDYGNLGPKVKWY